MNPLDLLNDYLRQLERRLQARALTRGVAIAGAGALLITVALVLFTNAFAFSSGSVTGSRVALFLALAFLLGFGLVLPLLRLNKRQAACKAEEVFPEFEERLLTFAERNKSGQADPFLELLADDTLRLAGEAEPQRVVSAGRILGFLCAAAASIAVLVWLGISGPGFMGYGTSLLWAGTPRGEQQPFYNVRVFPGDKRIRRGADQLVTANLIGFETGEVRLFARYESTSKWEEVRMLPEPGGSGYEFLFAGLPESVEYYVSAGVIDTEHYTLGVIDLPEVKNIRVTYKYPNWSGMENMVDENGGDLRAVEGTVTDLEIETDKPLEDGMLVLDDGSEITLRGGEGNWTSGSLNITQDGLYHVAALYEGERVRLTEDYFIEAQQESAPMVSIRRPGRDYRANPIEEVTIAVDADDDFGLQELSLRYSVNAGPENTVNLLDKTGADEASNSTVIYLEDFELVPGDLVSFYALARDARQSSQTDIFFIEAQPYEREFSQSQRSGGGGGGGGGGGEGQQQNEISARQRK